MHGMNVTRLYPRPNHGDFYDFIGTDDLEVLLWIAETRGTAADYEYIQAFRAAYGYVIDDGPNL